MMRTCILSMVVLVFGSLQAHAQRAQSNVLQRIRIAPQFPPQYFIVPHHRHHFFYYIPNQTYPMNYQMMQYQMQYGQPQYGQQQYEQQYAQPQEYSKEETITPPTSFPTSNAKYGYWSYGWFGSYAEKGYPVNVYIIQQQENKKEPKQEYKK